MVSTKNLPLSPATQDLGLGDQLRQQVEDETDEQKKAAMEAARQRTFGPAATDLLGAQRMGMM